MSHNSHKNTGYIADFQSNSARYFLTLCAVFCLFFTQIAAAAINSGAKTERNPIRVLKSDLSALAGQDQAILDWQTQEYELTFDLPADGWYESLDLFLTAIPEGNVGTTDPITISYNGEKPISLYGQASRFDAHIKLDPARIRTARNSLKIRYKTPHMQDCLTPEHGKWIIDLNRSKLATKTRSKPRDLHVVELKKRLNHPMTAPKRVAIRAFGQNKVALEALVAQGIANQIDNLPAFQFTTGNADLEVLVGDQNLISSYVNDPKMLETQAARAFTDSGTRPKLVLTGPSEDEVLTLARSFAKYELPVARRRSVALHEFYAAPAFKSNSVLTGGKYELSEIGDTTISPSWNPSSPELKFNVVDADSSHGTLVLNIVKSPIVSTQSRLKVRLNNQSIGYTMLDKKQKFVSFDIKPGMLRSAGNNIVIEPILTAQADGYNCSNLSKTPMLMVSNRSKLEIKTTPTPAEANLDQFAATGSPLFTSLNDQSAIVLTAKNSADRAASLKFIGYAAQQLGPRLVNAQYLTELPPNGARAQNMLIIGPDALKETTLLAAAPSAVKLALRGKPTTGPNTLTVASIERYASSDSSFATQRTAQRLSRDSRVQTGGIASLFASPYSDKHMIGVITSNRPSQFAKAMNSLTQPGYWNGLQGSVSRWNSNTIIMAQTANALPSSYIPARPKQTIRTAFVAKWSEIVDQVGSTFSKPKPVPEPEPLSAGKNQAVDQTSSLRGVSHPGSQSNNTEVKSPLLVQARSMLESGYSAAGLHFDAFRDNEAKMVATRKWVEEQAHNRTTLMALIVISIVLMIGLATPKFDR